MSADLDKGAAICKRVAQQRGIEPHEVALEFAELKQDEVTGEWIDQMPEGKDSRYWFDVAEHIKPDLQDRSWTEDDEKAAQEFVQNSRD